MSDREKALDNAMAQIERQFGKGSIMKMSDYGTKMNVESIPTGSIALDMALGGGRHGHCCLRHASVLHQQTRPSGKERAGICRNRC